MNVLMILDNEFPPDSRVEKEIQSLIDEGHYVYLACITYEKTALFEAREGWEIHRLFLRSKFVRKFSAAILVLPVYFQIWRKFIKQIVKSRSIEIIHVHDLPLSKIAYELSKELNCKLVLDQHEFYSNWIVDTAHMNTFIGRIINSLSNWTRYEACYLSLADLIITVAEPLRENYIKQYSIPEEKIITIPNTPTLRNFNQANVDSGIIEKYKDDFILFYAGGIDVLRGIDTAIKAMPKIIEVIPHVKIVLAGKIFKPYNPFITAQEIGVSNYIEFVGWIDESKLASYIQASQVCFHVPENTRDEVNKSIATKVYQYAAMKCPQIVGEAEMMKKFVLDNKLGYSVSNSSEFADKVIAIYNNGTPELFSKAKIPSWEDTISPLLNFFSESSDA